MNRQMVVPATDRGAPTVEYCGNKWPRPVGNWLLRGTQERTVLGSGRWCC